LKEAETEYWNDGVMEEWEKDGFVTSLKRLFSVIPAPYQVRGKLQQEYSLFKRSEFFWIPVFTGMATLRRKL